MKRGVVALIAGILLTTGGGFVAIHGFKSSDGTIRSEPSSPAFSPPSGTAKAIPPGIPQADERTMPGRFRVESSPLVTHSDIKHSADELSREMLLELAQALEADILADGMFHTSEALRAVNEANFADTMGALAAQAANDPRALAVAKEMADRLERSQRDPEVSQTTGRVVCGARLCVVEQRVPPGHRPASAFRVGSGQDFPQPDGSRLHRTVYVAQRGIAHYVAPTRS